MSWVAGLVLVLADLAIALGLVLVWHRRLRARYSRRTQFAVGWVGALATVLSALVGSAVAAASGLTFRAAVFPVMALVVGVGWLFFGDVWLLAFSEDERDARHPRTLGDGGSDP